MDAAPSAIVPGPRRPLFALSGPLDRQIAVLTDGRRRTAEYTVALIAMVLAWLLRFIQDDAFISFRFARNVALGRGAVFNLGDPVEGYTNFLWTMLMVIPERLGMDPVVVGQLLSVLLLGVTVVLSFRLAERVLGQGTLSFLAVVVLVGSVTFLGYGTGGLETQLQTTLVTAVAVLALGVIVSGEPPDAGVLVAVSTLCGLALLTRLDSAVLVLLWCVALLWSRRGDRDDPRRLAVNVAALVGPATVLVVPWMVWKVGYYGEILPNTFVAKSGSSRVYLAGLAYLAMFVVSYGLFLLLGSLVRSRADLWRSVPLRLLIAALVLWALYIVRSGGDFMEFRFMVPVLPLLACVIAALVARLAGRRQVGFLAVYLVCSLLHLTSLPYPALVSTFASLDSQVSSGPQDWSTIGRVLAEDFPGGLEEADQVLIAVGPAGAIPYYSDLPTVDMQGLNDPWIARHGPLRGSKPGHLRHAPVDYLERREVNLVIGLPEVVDTGTHEVYTFEEVQGFVGRGLERKDQLPPDARVLEIPITADRSLAALYLTSHPDIERRIESGEWAVIPVR